MTSRLEKTVETLAAALPGIEVRAKSLANVMEQPSIFDGPVLQVADGIAKGFILALFVDECDPLDKLAAAVSKAAAGEIDLGIQDDQQSTLYLRFTRMDAILDDSDFRIGETLRYQPIEHTHQAEVAA